MNVDARTAWDDVMLPFEEHELRRRADDAAMFERLGALAEQWPDDPAIPDLVCELAVRLGISAREAEERVRIAKALRALAHLARAHREGRFSRDQLRWVTRFATPDTDEEWSRLAPGMRPVELQQESCRQRRVTRLQEGREEALRSLSMEWDEERRLLSFYGTLAGERAAAFEAAITEAAQHVVVEDDVEDRRGARQADALLGLVTSGPREREMSRQRQQPATLVVHADAEVVAGVTDGTRRRAETSRGMQVRHEAVRRVACDAKVRVALEREGQPIGLVTTGRGVTDGQMELLWFRDRHCTFPGCERMWFVEAHHIRHWADGGRTTLDNLTLLCSGHHRKLHEGGWTIRGRPGRDLRFHDPDRARHAVAA